MTYLGRKYRIRKIDYGSDGYLYQAVFHDCKGNFNGLGTELFRWKSEARIEAHKIIRAWDTDPGHALANINGVMCKERTEPMPLRRAASEVK